MLSPAEHDQNQVDDAAPNPALDAALRNAARDRLATVPAHVGERVSQSLRAAPVRPRTAAHRWFPRSALLAASLTLAATILWFAVRPAQPVPPRVPASQALSRAVSILPTSGRDIRRVALAPIRDGQRLLSGFRWPELRGMGGTN